MNSICLLGHFQTIGSFIGGNVAFCLGGDYCWDLKKKYDLATKATSATFSGGPRYGFGYD